ncbi:MAG: YggS family pyridoxal phosphate-dependent enzyme [Actinobacteria bacterium]|nr:MAG: YggS family pyridoxal phosphate-dependent enzyme [Actinomycetota bacterium]
MTGRREEIGMRLDAVRAEIATSARVAGRQPEEITLVVVTKTFPASDVEHLAALGVLDVGENREQEGSTKASEVLAPISWHFIGQLQRKKVKSVLEWASVIHSVDRLELAEEIVKRAVGREQVLRVLVQVSLDGAQGRAGARRSELSEIASLLSTSPMVDLAGLMAVAPLDEDPRIAFQNLQAIRADFILEFPEALWCSAGMSGDFAAAIEFGATHVRVGSSILGSRPTFG